MKNGGMNIIGALAMACACLGMLNCGVQIFTDYKNGLSISEPVSMFIANLIVLLFCLYIYFTRKNK